MRFLWDFIVIVTVIVWVLTLFIQGYIPSSLVVLVLLLTPVILALGRGLGGSVSKTVRFLFRVGIVLASLATFLVIFSGGNLRELGAMMGSFLALFLVLIAFYFLFYGLFSRGKR